MKITKRLQEHMENIEREQERQAYRLEYGTCLSDWDRQVLIGPKMSEKKFQALCTSLQKKWIKDAYAGKEKVYEPERPCFYSIIEALKKDHGFEDADFPEFELDNEVFP